MTVGIIADDLTGATDTVVQFREAGWRSYLLLSDTSVEVHKSSEPTAWSRSLDTRAELPDDAKRITADAVSTILAEGGDRLYVKIDSTMRGSVAAQVDGALEAWSTLHPDAFALICPAYPQTGRIVTDGTMHVHGVPLIESPAASDPVTPVRSSLLTDLIPGSASVRVGTSEHETAAALLEASRQNRKLIVDAESPHDLELLTKSLLHIGEAAVCVGSAGWARYLASDWLPLHVDSSPAIERRRHLPVVVLVTSLNETSLKQADHLSETMGSDAVAIALSSDDLSSGDIYRRIKDKLTALSTPTVILLQPTQERDKSQDPLVAARTISQGLAQIVAQLLDEEMANSVVLVGGDGAEAVLDELGAGALHIEYAAAEGVPLSTVVNGSTAGTVVVTKAGGFGEITTLTDVVGTIMALEKGFNNE